MEGSRSRSHGPESQLVVIRSSDGAAFSISLHDLEQISSLDQLRKQFLSPLLEIPNDCLITMNDQGIPVTRDEAFQHLLLLLRSDQSGETQVMANTSNPERQDHEPTPTFGERRLYVFDREHLDADPETVATLLRIDDDMVLNEPPLNPEDPLTSHLSLSLHNLSTLQALISSITNQRASLSLALANLHRVNTGTCTSFRLYQETATPQLDQYEQLLQGWEHNMDSIKRVRVVNGLLVRGGSSATSQRWNDASNHQRESSSTGQPGSAVRSGPEEKQRFLGDYVSTEKMVAVRDGCAKVLAELKMRTEALQVTLDDVVANAEAVQADLEATSRDLEDLEACEQDAENGHRRIEELVHAGESMTDPELLAQCFDELSVCDAEHRDRIRFLIERKNAMTRYQLLQMQKISALQSDIASMPSDLGILDHDLRTRTENFKHLARLEGLIPAYLATVAEVIRRREYNRLLVSQSQSLSEQLVSLTNVELSRRRHYRSNFSGKLPWEVRGLGVGADELVPAISFAVDARGVEGLPDLDMETLNLLRQAFEDLVADLPNDTKGSLLEHPLRAGKKQLEGLITNIHQLSQDFERIAANSSAPPEPAVDATQIALLESQVRQLEEANETLSRQLQSERSSHEETVAQLENRCSVAEGAQEKNRGLTERLRKDVEEREKELGSLREHREVETRKSRQAEAERDRVQAEVTKLESSLKDKARNLDELEDALGRLQGRLGEKEKELKELRAEADLDRAVLEKELSGIREQLDSKSQDFERQETRNRTLEEIADGLRERIARWETVVASREEDIDLLKRELEETRMDKEKGIVDVQKELVQSRKQARAAVMIAAKLRDENDNITHALNLPPAPKADASAAAVDSAVPPPVQIAPTLPVPPIDYASCDIEALLLDLEQVTHVPLTEAIRNKMDGLTMLTKKWVKEAKAYRERAHRAASGSNDKIAFRHFTKGDLALFLPTRNSAVPVWAAFNVSFPHHFLSPTGVIAEQMKTREWIVARIVTLSETIVDVKDPATNPYLLAAGTKFYLLEVEPWSSKESSRARKHSSDKDKDKGRNGDRKSSSTTPSRPVRSSSDALASTRAPSSTAESAIFVDRPGPAQSPSIRRTVSEGFPASSEARVRPDYAIVEVDEPSVDAGKRSPSPNALKRSKSPLRGSGDPGPTSPSGIARALARSQPATPVQQKPDPFVPSSSPSSNPFQLSSSPVVGSPLRQTASPPTTDYDPSHSTSGASPAFLPSAGKKVLPPSNLGASVPSPRYIRSSPTSRKDARSPSTSGARPSPISLLASSPASPSANSIHAMSQSRSASSGSSILSSSMHRRRLSGLNSVSPSSIDGKAPPTKEAQLNDSRWNLLQDGLTNEGLAYSTTSTLTVSADGPTVDPKAGTQSENDSRRFGSVGRSLLGSSGSTPSVLDILTGKHRTSSSNVVERSSTARTPPQNGSSASSLGKDSAASEIRKLLGQPPF
ncbi:uncharacterized protein JCM15063_003877 [Sporobolomyces koalae]|uniref:uncharacterized protein n=1 Tax=Sporobolomyces koalae TaxID=500713 RepID=UPI003178D293